MTSTDWLSISGLIVGVLGVAYAIYENRSKAKLAEFIRAQNWHNYSKTNNANLSVQLAFNKYKQTAQSFDLEVFEWLSKADAFGQDVFKDVIRQIQVSEPSFTQGDVDKWVKEGRIEEEHAPLFYMLTPTSKAKRKDKKEPEEDINY